VDASYPGLRHRALGLALGLREQLVGLGLRLGDRGVRGALREQQGPQRGLLAPPCR
jgi:hypothetical protein